MTLVVRRAALILATMSRHTVFLLAAALALPASAQNAPSPAPSPAAHPLTVNDIFRLHDVGSPVLSPDGQWVLYTVSTVDLEKDKRITNLWMAKWDGSENLQLTYGNESAGSPRWSPDGRYISFTSSRQGNAKGSQVWILDRRGGEARQLTNIKGDLNAYAWSPDAKQLVLTIVPEDKDEAKPGEASDKKGEQKQDEKPKPLVIDRYHFKQDVEGYLKNDRHAQLFLFDVATVKLDKLTTDTRFEEGNAVWSPDGSRIAFVSNHDPDPDRTTNSDVFVVDARAGSAPKQLTTFHGPDGGRLSWSPDSKLIAYTQGSEPRFLEYNQNQLAVVPAAGGAPRVLTARLDRAVSQPCFSADGRQIVVLVTDDRSEYPASVDVESGTVHRLLEQKGTVMTQDAAASHAGVLFTDDTTPPEVYAFEDGKLRRLTHQNDAVVAQLKLGETRDLETRAKDGAEVHGVLTLPVGYVSGKKYPMLLRIHGGPDAQDGHAFVVERQIFAGRGYAVLNVNYRGSAGRSAAYQQAIWADWGNKEVIDLLAAVDEAVQQGVADPDRLGIGGWSYGGILTDYTIASTTRFKAAISGAGTANPLAFYGVDQYILQYDLEIGPPWKSGQLYMKLAYPLLHADRIRTPTLFMGGDKDFNVPLIGGEQMYQALRSLGIPTELVIYPGQFHGFTRPSFIVDRYNRYLGWYDKYLMPGAAAERK